MVTKRFLQFQELLYRKIMKNVICHVFPDPSLRKEYEIKIHL